MSCSFQPGPRIRRRTSAPTTGRNWPHMSSKKESRSLHWLSEPLMRENIMGNQDRNDRSASASGKQTEVAVLAAGCFWGVEEILRDVPGVVDTEVGYTGGWLENPKYADTHQSKSGHAEAIRVT